MTSTPNKSGTNLNNSNADAEAHFQKLLNQSQAVAEIENPADVSQPDVDGDAESDLSSAGSTQPTPRDGN